MVKYFLVILCFSNALVLISAAETFATVNIEYSGLVRLTEKQLSAAASAELSRYANDHRESNIFDASYAMLQYMNNIGYYFAKVNYTFVPNKKHPEKIVFEIEENTLVTIDHIEITGAKAWENWSDSDITHTLGSPIKGLLKHFGVGDLIFRASDSSNAINSIATAYLLHGYQRVKVGPEVLEWNHDKTKVSVLIPVEEGPQFLFSNLQIETDHSGSNLSKADAKKSYANIEITGSPFHPRLLREKIGLIRRRLNDMGYLAANVDGSYLYDLDEGLNTVNARIYIQPGPQYLFNELIINGDPFTRIGMFKYYSRRLVGEKPISYTRVEESIGYLYRMGVFEYIRWQKIVKTINDNGTVTADILLDVKELPKRSLAFTVGYGSYEELRTGVTYSNRNLFGIGLDGEINYDISLKSQSLDSSLYMGEYYRKRFLILQTGWEEREEPSFDSEVFDAQLRYRELHGLSDSLEGLVGYNFEQSEATNIAPDVVVDSDGAIIVSSLEYAETLELRDNLFNPTQGIRLRGNIEWSSKVLGSDVDFMRYEANLQYYKPFGEDHSTVLATNFRINYYDLLESTDSLPIQKRLFLGGENSVRSFKRHELGPASNNGDPIGGLSSALTSVELRFPLFPSYNLSGAFFWDAGLIDQDEHSFDADIGQGVGFGIRFDLPIGPIRLDVAKNVGEEFSTDYDYVVHFSLGFSF